MIFYFSFFNIVAMQQLLELGIGFTLKQYISHSYSIGNNKEGSSYDSYCYFKFANVWFSIISLFILIIVGFGGVAFYSDYVGEISWLYPWVSLVVVSAFSSFNLPKLILIEASQRQELFYKSRLIYSLAYSILLAFLLYKDLGLFSISISMLISLFLQYAYLYRSYREIIKRWHNYVFSKTEFKSVLKEIWPMLSRMSVTWFTGFFFWNSFNLIAYKNLPLVEAGKFAFTLSLTKSAYNLCEALISSQLTYFGRLISEDKKYKSYQLFKRYLIISILLLTFGYSLVVISYILWPNFYLFDKMIGLSNTVSVFLYFLFLFPIVLKANYCRCFKIEPYMYFSVFLNLSIPIIFFFTSKFYGLNSFSLLVCPLFFYFIWSLSIFKVTLKRFNVV